MLKGKRNIQNYKIIDISKKVETKYLSNGKGLYKL